MKVSFVNATSFEKTLSNLLTDCTELDVAMAYVKIGGLRTFLRVLGNSPPMKGKKQIRIVFGLSSHQGITDKASAQLLFELARKHNNVTIKKYDNRKFHPKLMIFRGPPHAVMIGSSNMTIGAQKGNCEANAVIQEPDEKFWADVASFFETYFGKAPILEKTHVEGYNPRPHLRGTKGNNFREDALPISPSKSINENHNAGQPKLPKSYYDKKIYALENKKDLNQKERRSLGAYRALRTRYYGDVLNGKQKLALLLAVTYGEQHLEEIAEKGNGRWTIGRNLVKEKVSAISHVYFYENKIKEARYEGVIQNVQVTQDGLNLIFSEINRLPKSKRLPDFKKHNGENISMLGCLAYVLDAKD